MIILIIIVIFLIAYALYMIYYIRSGFSLKKDYDSFYNFLMEKSKKEQIYVYTFNKLDEINLNEKYEDRVLGRYYYIKNATIQTNISKKLPKIEWCKEHVYTKNNKSLFSLMVFAHELGHHYAITINKDYSEEMADKYALKLFNEHFNIFKKIIYSPLIILYYQK